LSCPLTPWLLTAISKMKMPPHIPPNFTLNKLQFCYLSLFLTLRGVENVQPMFVTTIRTIFIFYGSWNSKRYIIVLMSYLSWGNSLTLTQNIIHNKVKMRRRNAGNYVDKHCTILDSNIRNSVCTPAKLPCRRVAEE
jgi:hypothetical protein